MIVNYEFELIKKLSIYANSMGSGKYTYRWTVNHIRLILFGAIQTKLLCIKSIPSKKNQRTMKKSNYYWGFKETTLLLNIYTHNLSV